MSGFGAASNGCAGNAPKLDWQGKIWTGNPDLPGIVRNQENEFIFANDPRFRGYKCISDPDFVSLFDRIVTMIGKCEKWGN